MKILILNFSDVEGGAARAAKRLHMSLVNEGIDSKMLVLSKRGDDNNTIGPESTRDKILSKAKSVLNTLPLRMYHNRPQFSPSFSPSLGLARKINEQHADIVHLHWINAGMLRIEDLAEIKSPIVWSLHDMWPFTGGCHYSGQCSSYEASCGNCPVLKSLKENDLSRKQFERKQKVYPKLANLTIVGLSKWMVECVKTSQLFKHQTIVNLPNPIDTNVFKPFDKMKARELWGLPLDKKLVLFGSLSATSDTRKGYNELKLALQRIHTKDIELLIFGSSKPTEEPTFAYKTHYLGHIHDDISLTALYNCADIMVVPSIQENLSNAIMESLSCGLPVLSFDIGGNKDMIDHKINGYLAKSFDIDDLAKGIDWILNNNNYDSLSENGRNKVIENYDSRVLIKRYIKMYHEILNPQITK